MATPRILGNPSYPTSDGKPIDSADVHLSGPIIVDGVTKDGGIFLSRDLVPGDYRITAEKDKVAADDVTVNVPEGSDADTDQGSRHRPARASRSKVWAGNCSPSRLSSCGVPCSPAARDRW